MNCPFCGGEMLPGALELPLRSGLDPIEEQDVFRWVPPADGSPQKVHSSGGALGEMLGELRSTLLKKPWDRRRAVPLAGHFGARDVKAVLLSGQQYLEDTWYCPACEKAVCVFSKGQPDKTWDEEKDGQGAEQEPICPPDQTPSQKDPWEKRGEREPWEKQGLFGPRKPDWEK